MAKWLKSLIGGGDEHNRIIEIAIDQIAVREEHGPLNEANVQRLAQSIAQIGILHPIYLRRSESGYVVEIGRHRFGGALRAGLQTVPCIIFEGEDELLVELARIDENLTRNELGPSDYAMLVARRDEIFKELASRPIDELSQSASASERIAGSIRDHAERTGDDKDKVHRALKRGKALGRHILEKTSGTSLDKDVELDALAKMPVEDRERLVTRAVAQEPVSARTSDGRPRERKVRHQLKPLTRALCGFRRWREDNPCVGDIAHLSRLISKIEAILSSDDPSSAQPDQL